MTKRFTATTNSVFHLFVTLGPIGYLPYAPGTYGSVLACILLYFFSSVFTHPLFVLIFIVVSLIVLNSLTLEVSDPGYIIIDEVAGMFIAMAGQGVTFLSLLAGFVLFRFFDIVKPYPIRRVEALPKGYGILADDIVAGVFANLLLILGRRMMP
ncbi:MAG: phosphatidylglycerophosphatase [Deltaproteobacteria bacterium]|nr:phosphatidylglycerophosphatase [Deltaproteobacteria bacterium]